MKTYKVSVIVPVYNAEKYLQKCVASLMAQTYPDLEIVLVDDGSRDRSLSLCMELAKKDSRIHVIHKENGGLVSAWKCGVEESKGQYLSFVDSDDWVDPEMVYEMADYLTGNKKEIVASDYVIERQITEEVYESQYIWQKLKPGEYTGDLLKEMVIPYLLGKESRYVTISRCMKLISRKLIEDNMKYSDPMITFGEDMTIMLPALIDCERLVVMDHKAYYHYLYVRESMIHKYNPKLFSNVQYLREIMDHILTDKFEGDELVARRKQADQESIFLLLSVLKNEARGNPGGFRGNIKDICKEPEVQQLVRRTQVKIEQRSNQLLYLVLKRPNQLHLSILRLAMILYYRKGRS